MASPSVLGQLMWEPARPEETRIDRFRRRVASKYGPLEDYEAFWHWSCANPSTFWSLCWDEVVIISSKKGDHVLDSKVKIYPPPEWFKEARLNFSENLLRHSHPSSPLLDSPALIQACEPDPSASTDFRIITTTHRELRNQVACAVEALRKSGVQKGDRIASYSSNCSANVVALLASAAIGAIWSSSAADFAPQGVLERLSNVRPKVLFAVDGVRYNGRIHDHIDKVKEVVKGLRSGDKDQQQLERVIIIPYISQIGGQASQDTLPNDWTTWDDFLTEGKEKEQEDVQFEQLSFNHPLWILFSSGTTGKPKAILHQAGGMLLQLAKEHLLHSGMTSDDVFFQYTTPGWMMWNFLITGMLSGAPIVLFDGSPLRPASTLWSLADQLGVTIFGTSAAYLSALEKSDFSPIHTFPHHKVIQILSTGSPLRPDLYSFVRDQIGKDILVGSITGGTDICSLFAGNNVALPVRAGELQARNLGMDIDVFDELGQSVASSYEPGDLVCKTPFPAQPLGFYGQSEERHYDTYYSHFPNVWYHGDYVALSRHNGLVMMGRSDGILNPGGIRFGSSEIYEALEESKDVGNLNVISQSLACSLKTPKGDDEVVVLFIVLAQTLKEEQWKDLESSIRKVIRDKRSARHVPKFIMQIEGVPLTLNGKLAEVPAKKSECCHQRSRTRLLTYPLWAVINGASLSTINSATLQNPKILESYVQAGIHLRQHLQPL